MTPWLSAYRARCAASARGTVTGRDRGSETAGRLIPNDVGQPITGRLTVTGPAAAGAVAVPGRPADRMADDADGADPLLTADVPHPASRIKAAASSTAATGAQRRQPRSSPTCL